MTLSATGLRLVSILVAVVLLAGCAFRPPAGVLQPMAVPTPPQIVEVLAVTNRLPASDGGFGPVRATSLSYELYSISVPLGSNSTEITYASAKPDPTREFLVLARTPLTKAQFINEVRRRKTATGAGGLYVHGYNQSYQEALFRLAQVSADAGAGGPVVLFSWPSEASLFGYVADRDTSLSSRDDLAAVMTMLTGEAGLKQLVVAGHSMGTFLVMETARQLKLSGKTAVLSKLGFILAAPDIDPDLFRTQLQTIGRTDPPILVMVSRDDQALAISSQLSGNRPRVGLMDVNDPSVQAVVQEFGITVIDITSVQPGDPFKHDGFASMAKFATRLAAAEGTGIPVATRAGLFVFDVTKLTLSTPVLAGIGSN